MRLFSFRRIRTCADVLGIYKAGNAEVSYCLQIFFAEIFIHAAGVVHLEDRLCRGARILIIYGADELFAFHDAPGRHGKFIDVKPYEDERTHRVRAHFSAYADGDSLPVRRGHDLVDHIENRGVVRLEHIRDKFVCAVHGERELDEVVRADAEEIHFLREFVHHYHGGWDFDHATDLRFGNFDALRGEFVAAFAVERFRGTEFLKAGDHREHDAEVPFARGEDERLELFLEKIFPVKAYAYGTPAHERIRFACRGNIGDELVAAGVERADGDRMRFHRAQNVAVGLRLFFAGRSSFAEEHEFGTVESDAGRAEVEDVVRFQRKFDVRVERYVFAIARHRLQLAHCEKLLFLLEKHGVLFLEAAQVVAVRVQNYFSARTVDENRVALLREHGNVAQTGYCRNLHGARENRDVARASAGVRRESDDLFFFERDERARAEFMRNENRAFVLALSLDFACNDRTGIVERREETVVQIAEVHRAFAHHR